MLSVPLMTQSHFISFCQLSVERHFWRRPTCIAGRFLLEMSTKAHCHSRHTTTPSLAQVCKIPIFRIMSGAWSHHRNMLHSYFIHERLKNKVLKPQKDIQKVIKIGVKMDVRIVLRNFQNTFTHIFSFSYNNLTYLKVKQLAFTLHNW